MPVAPLAGAWIEISSGGLCTPAAGSLPSRERGLKSVLQQRHYLKDGSLPSRERGLKFDMATHNGVTKAVAPLAGAWIEIRSTSPSVGI